MCLKYIYWEIWLTVYLSCFTWLDSWMVYYSAWPPRCKAPLVLPHSEVAKHRRVKLHPCPAIKPTSFFYIWTRDVYMNDRAEWKEGERKKARGNERRAKWTNLNKTGMNREEVYVGVHSFSCLTHRWWKGNIVQLIQCFLWDNKSAWVQIKWRQLILHGDVTAQHWNAVIRSTHMQYMI